MQLNLKKLKRNANIGDRPDLGPLIVNIISLFGIGFFYWFFIAGILPGFISALFLALFAALYVITFVLYTIGRVCRYSAEKQVFSYVNHTILGIKEQLCRGDCVDFTIDISLKNNTVLFTLSGGNVKAVCDFTAAKKMPAASTLFIAACLGVIGSKINGDIQNGKSYKVAVYSIIINGGDCPAQYFVEDGVPNAAELDRAIRIYNHNCKKYLKKKKI